MADRAAALESLPDLDTRNNLDQDRATGTDEKSLVSGLVLSLVEQGTPKKLSVSSNDSEKDTKHKKKNNISADDTCTYDRLRHQVTQSVTEADRIWRGG